MVTAGPNMEKLHRVSLGKKIGQVNSMFPRRTQWRMYQIALILMDVLMVNIAFVLAYYLRFKGARFCLLRPICCNFNELLPNFCRRDLRALAVRFLGQRFIQ